MALRGCSADAAREALLQRAKDRRRTPLEECWIALGTLGPPVPGPDRRPEPAVAGTAGRTGPELVGRRLLECFPALAGEPL